jgi:hypothetical protein
MAEQQTIEIMRCTDCLRLALSYESIRITGHKCSGRWTTIGKAVLSPEVAQLTLTHPARHG